MSTLTPEKRKNIKAQLDAIQKTLEKIKAARAGQSTNSSLPEGLNAAQIGGASGVGFESEDDQVAISEIVKETNEEGRPKSEAGTKGPSTFSSSQADFAVRGAGLDGIVDTSQFVGLSPSEARRRIQAERAKRTGQVSANTTFAFNPETLKQTQRAIDKFGFALDDVTNDPFEPKEFKDEELKNVVEVTGRELGKLFESPDQLQQAYSTNQQFKDTLDKFIAKGGSIEAITKNIAAAQSTPLQTLQESLGGPNVQSPSEYLASLQNPEADPAAQAMALEELAPESEIAQNEIARIAQIPDDLKSLYFGDEKTMGLLQMRQQQAEQRKTLIEQQEKDAKRTARERAELTIDKNRADVEIQKNKIEENRLAAKNYMTARLAKLGALKTTGKAPEALQTLETKYQGQVTQLETAFKFLERETEIGLEESLDEIQNKADDIILSIEEDLTLDTEKSMKEILKARQDADKEIYRITEQYARRLRTQTSKYAEDLKKEAEAYAKAYAKTASNGLNNGPLSSSASEGKYVDGKGVLLPNGKYAPLDLTPALERKVQSANLSGIDTIRYFTALPTKYQEFIMQEAQSEGTKFSTLSKLKQRYEEIKEVEESDDIPNAATDPLGALEAKLGL